MEFLNLEIPEFLDILTPDTFELFEEIASAEEKYQRSIIVLEEDDECINETESVLDGLKTSGTVDACYSRVIIYALGLCRYSSRKLSKYNQFLFLRTKKLFLTVSSQDMKNTINN